MSVVIETTLGDITVDLYLNERPRACLNFLKLCKIKYYNFNLFHTISRGFIAQTGDPTGSRTGGESIFGVIEGTSKKYFEAENEPRIKHTRPGIISFVGGEDNMVGSQFFLTLGEDLTYLDEKHCVFGEVVEGLEVLEAINEVICDKDDRPYQDVRITHTVVLDDPLPDPQRLKVPSRSPSPSAARLAGGRIAPDEEIDETSGRSNQEVAELQAEREAKARATILEMVGDIPDAEMAPPENVLFVCKLNPVTTDYDLEIIFSRFGKIKSCEVIRDRKSGDSLQYAFIEFEEQKSCEDAYFKMGNVLIDDRRIHVDFSQSVSKVKWLGKGRGVTHYDDKGNKRKIDANNDIGQGNYRVRNGAQWDRKTEKRRSRSPIRDNRRDNSPSRRNRPSNRSPKRRSKSRSPLRPHQTRRLVERKRSKSPSPIKARRKSRSPTYKRKYSRSPDQLLQRNNRLSSYRRRSKSPNRIRTQDYLSNRRSGRKLSPIRRYKSPVRNMTPHGKHKDHDSPKTPRKLNEIAKRSRMRSRSPSHENTQIHPLQIGQENVSRSSTVKSLSPVNKSDKRVPSLKPSKSNEKLEKIQQKEDEGKRKAHLTKKHQTSSDSEKEKPKKKKSKKKVQPSTESSSSEEDSSSSSSEEEKLKSKKRKIMKKIKAKKSKKTKKCKKKYSSSSDSSSSGSESSSSESSSTSESASKSKRKKSKMRTRSSSASD